MKIFRFYIQTIWLFLLKLFLGKVHLVQRSTLSAKHFWVKFFALTEPPVYVLLYINLFPVSADKSTEMKRVWNYGFEGLKLALTYSHSHEVVCALNNTVSLPERLSILWRPLIPFIFSVFKIVFGSLMSLFVFA